MDDVFASLRADNASSFSFVDLEDNDLVLVEPAIEKRVEGEEAMFPESFDGNLNVSMDGSCSQTSLHPQDLLVSDEEMDLLSEHEADMEESPPQLSQRIDHVDSQDSTQCIHTESPEHGSYLGSDSSEELDQRFTQPVALQHKSNKRNVQNLDHVPTTRLCAFLSSTVSGLCGGQEKRYSIGTGGQKEAT